MVLRRSCFLLMAIVFIALVCGNTLGETVYVDPDAPGPIHDGSNWNDAYLDLQDALTAAISGDEIRVAEGVYKPAGVGGDRTVSFVLKNGVGIYGGYAGFGEPDPNSRETDLYETILSGDLNGNDGANFANNGENSYHVVTGDVIDETTILDGLSICGGSNWGKSTHGGGMLNSGSPTINNCTFRNNKATWGGGMGNSGNPRLINCRFSRNSATYGGGMRTTTGSPTLINCIFSGNSSIGGGGGISSYSSANLTLINCTFIKNSTGSEGGGINIRNTNVVVANCILWGNIPEQIYQNGGTVDVSYSDVQGSWSGIGNIDEDPLFIDANGEDDLYGTADDILQLAVGSDCIDVGDNSSVPIDIVSDIEGTARIINGIVDMGACEFDPERAVLEVSPMSVQFNAYEAGTNPDDQILTISNGSGGTLNWQITEACDWLSVDPDSGSSTGETNNVSLSVDISGLNPGTYDCDLTVSDPCVVNSPQTVHVSLVITSVWRNDISFPDDPFNSETIFESDPSWVKFTIKLDDPNTVYFQDSKLYPFHYFFATQWLEPFIGMTVPEYFNVTLYEPNQLAVLGAVILPPMTGEPPLPVFEEYGIQFIRYDHYTREEIAEMFNVVKANVIADPGVTAFYFPTYEQSQVAEENQDWFESQGIPIGSIAQWIEDNICYSPGWALGELKFFPGDEIQSAYLAGDLLPEDILLTDGVPAEIPFVAGIISLSPSTPNSHVAILARTYGIPFVHLANLPDIEKAWQLLGHLTLLCVEQVDDTYNVQLKDAEHEFLPDEIASFLALKEPATLNISPTAVYGGYTSSTDSLLPSDIQYFGGKAANYGMLRQAIDANSPEAIAISFDLWNEFLDQPVVPRNSVTIAPNGFALFWADQDIDQGNNHAGFKLNAEGDYIVLFDRDGTTLITGIVYSFSQISDVSCGRTVDGGDLWQLFADGSATPGYENSPGSSSGSRLVINEFMAKNDSFLQDNFGEYDDWFELYNASSVPIDLGGMYLTDDPDDPTDWMIPPTVTGSTLRQEIANRLSGYTYPPSDMAALSRDLSAIRSLFKNTYITSFTPAQVSAIETVLQNNFDANEKIRFRSSTNVEDSEQFTGAGLYDSYSGCLADNLDADSDGPCICDPDKTNERGVFRAIRKVFASFYNDNAFLERLRHGVDESQVGMALLVHHSFPDEIELANGVATMEKKQSQSGWEITLVTQKGAVSVSNPGDDSIAEQVSVSADSGGNSFVLIRQSNLVILGETVMEWEADYNDLTQLLVAAAEEFESVTGKSEYILDFEYKKVAAGGAAVPAGGLVVKQIREIPKLDVVSTTCPSVSCSCGPNGRLFEETHQWPNDVSIETSLCVDPSGIDPRFISLCRTVIRGYTTKPIILRSSDSQFYWQQGRPMHMCYQYSFTPSLEPGADQCTLNQLRAQDIKTISMYYMGWCGGPWASLETTGFGGEPFYLGDYESDGDVDMLDFAMFAQRWLDSDCGLCGGIDLDCDSKVGLEDLFMFADNWLIGK